MRYIVKRSTDDGSYREAARLMAELKAARRELRTARREVKCAKAA